MLKHVLFTLCCLLPFISGYVVNEGTSCYLYPESTTHFGHPVDDSSSITEAFELCGINGTVIFTNNTFNVDRVLNTTNLANCNVSLQGELLFSSNIPYWLSHSLNVGLQNQTTAWLFGGTNVTFTATGNGAINGNGQAWYTQNRNNSNEPGRPISITFYNSTNLYVSGLKIIQPQFWATFISYSKNVTMDNIYINATSNDEWGTDNTDGADTWNSDSITLTNWNITNGDDCIAAKGNTSNLYVGNVTCYGSTGMTIGSVGQYPETPDYNTNTTFEDITLYNAVDGAYIKTWQGVTSDSTGNGDAGGGGSGYIKNITFRNFQLTNVGLPIQITQCIYTEGAGSSACDTSKMQISDITFENFTGTSTYNVAASLHCASSHPCPDIFLKDIDVLSINQTLGLPAYNTTLPSNETVIQCANILNQNTTLGVTCNRYAPNNFPQKVSANVGAVNETYSSSSGAIGKRFRSGF